MGHTTPEKLPSLQLVQASRSSEQRLLCQFLGTGVALKNGMSYGTQDFLMRFDDFQEQLNMTVVDAFEQSHLLFSGRYLAAVPKDFVLGARKAHFVPQVFQVLYGQSERV